MEDFLWGIVNGVTAWPILIVHLFGAWDRYPIYNIRRDSGWYQFGFLLGSGSPALGLLSGRIRPWDTFLQGRRGGN